MSLVTLVAATWIDWSANFFIFFFIFYSASDQCFQLLWWSADAKCHLFKLVIYKERPLESWDQQVTHWAFWDKMVWVLARGKLCGSMYSAHTASNQVSFIRYISLTFNARCRMMKKSLADKIGKHKCLLRWRT